MKVNGGGFGRVGGGPSAGGGFSGAYSGTSLLSETSLESAMSFPSDVIGLLEKFLFEAMRLPWVGLKAATSATVNALSACDAGLQRNKM